VEKRPTLDYTAYYPLYNAENSYPYRSLLITWKVCRFVGRQLPAVCFAGYASLACFAGLASFAG